MNTDEAIRAARRWLDYLDTQKAKAKKMVELARLAKTDHAEALRQKRQMDASPTVYDGGNLEPAVRFLIAEIERLRADQQQGWKDYCALMARYDRQHVLIERLKELLGAARDDMADIVSKIDAALAPGPAE